MGREVDLKNELIRSIIQYVRSDHAETIDKAYDYFWDRYSPDEFLAGTALELGFINFEDWLVIDYPANEQKERFIDVYMKKHPELKSEEKAMLDKIRGSILSLYEVEAVSKDKRVLLKDLLMDGEFSIRDKRLTNGLKKGDIFATRLLELDGGSVMSGCVYPYSRDRKKGVLNYIEKEFKRYLKNVNPQGSMREYLKDYGDVFNIVWIHLIMEPPVRGN